MRALDLSDEDQDLVAAYSESLRDAGFGEHKSALWAMRDFCSRVGGPTGWEGLSFEGQRKLCNRRKRVVRWLIVTQRVTASIPYIVTGEPGRIGETAERFHRDLFGRYRETATGIGFTRDHARRQWAAIWMVAGVLGVSIEQLDAVSFETMRDELVAESGRHCPIMRTQHLAMHLHQAGAVLFNLGILARLPRARGVDRVARRRSRWEPVAVELAATIHRYLDQLGAVQRPATVTQVEGTLREFALFLAGNAPEVKSLRDVARIHIESYKTWLGTRPSARGEQLSRSSVRKRLAIVRNLFERLIEWESPDAPDRVPVLAHEGPVNVERLPRFLDDGAATKLLVAARNDPEPFVRLCVEFLARTGLRIGEFLDLTVDAVVQIGSSYWLRVPLGKMHNDRYVPLHPQLKAMLDEWLDNRPKELRSPYMFVDRGRQISRSKVVRALDKVATTAGIGHVTPHQLRHTLATQAINRGMSLEALAALLGHKSLSMTLVYARIADRTVADEYFAVSEKVEALYDKAQSLPESAEGKKMSQVRHEMDRRMLGNGYCARPVELDCHFESICESCTFFVTTIDFKPTLERQRDDADAKGQVGRKRVFDGLLARLEQDAS